MASAAISAPSGPDQSTANGSGGSRIATRPSMIWSISASALRIASGSASRPSRSAMTGTRLYTYRVRNASSSLRRSSGDTVAAASSFPGVGVLEQLVQHVAGGVPGRLRIQVVAVPGDEGDQPVEHVQPAPTDQVGEPERDQGGVEAGLRD